MNLRAAIATLVALALAACQEAPVPSDEGVARPILYEVADGTGNVQAWLFGTIHALPDGTKWRSAKLNQSIDRAGMLMVEIAALENEPRTRAVFARLATTPGQPDVGLKVNASDRPRLFEMIRKTGLSPRELSATETWAVALLLAQLGGTGDAENGADRAIVRAFLGREIIEFEGVEMQLGIFDQLPEREQRDLLSAVIDEYEEVRKDPSKLRRAWLEGDESTLLQAMNTGILSDPELREALLVGRNQAWLQQLEPRIETGDRPFVAVGTAHLLGDDGLIQMLRDRGYKVSRLQ